VIGEGDATGTVRAEKLGAVAPRDRPGRTHDRRGLIMGMTLRSDAFADGKAIPRRYSGDGEDLSPPLTWSGLPEGTRELALVVDDPDAPRAEPWVHWVLYKIPADAQSLTEGVPQTAAPGAHPGVVQGKNSWGTVGYRGPAPPKGHGTHHYHFRLYALDAPLTGARGLDKGGLLEAVRGHVLAEAELVGTYER
jgi:Raf kinase inhibitor-like YbhB/YbcL family protein